MRVNMVYMGSKARLAKYIVPIIQGYITEDTVGYLEPFVGGANMIQHIKHEKRYGSDINKYLIALLKYAQDLNNILPETITEDEYNRVKTNKDNYDDWYVGLVGFCSSYSGKFFGGYPRDRQTGRNLPNEMIRNLQSQRHFLHNISFKNADFNNIRKIKGFVIYCDPPYFGTTKYKCDLDHSIFWDWVREFSKSNIVLVSEYTAPNDFEIIFEKELTTTLSNSACNTLGYKKDIERLFKWKE